MYKIRKPGIFLIIIMFFLVILLPFSTIYSSHGLRLSQDSNNSVVRFSKNILLSTDDSNYDHHVEVSMAISDNGIIFVGWKNSETHYGGGARVSIVKSADGGKTWTQPHDMEMFEGRSTRQSDPWLYWYNGTIYYAYLEFDSTFFTNPGLGNLTQITVAKSNDYGDTWIPVKATDGNYFADKETIVVGENNTVYVVYDDANTETVNGNVTIRVSRSIDGGDTYQEISSLGEDEFYIGPYITLNSSGHPFICWSWLPPSGGNLFITESLDGGLTFVNPRMINQDGNYCMYEASPSKLTLPVIEFDHNNRLYVLWADKFDQPLDTWDVYLRYSDNFGVNWSDRIQVNPTTAGHQWHPEMTIDDTGKLHIIYYSELEGWFKPYYRTVHFTGPQRNNPILSDEIVISNRDTPSIFTRPGEYMGIQLDQNGIPHVAWSDGRSNEMDIYYAHGIAAQSFPIEIVVIIVIVAIIGAICIVVIFRIRRKRTIE